MKILLIITVISLLLNIESFAQWEIQVSPEDHLPNLNSVFLFTDSIGVAIGQNGTILKTYNGGDVWYKINSPTNQNLHDLSFINSDEGWAIGDSIILNTTNGGDSWSFKKLTQPLSFEQASGIFTQIQFLDDKNGWIAGNASSAFGYQEYVILKTSDGGANWDTLGPYSGYEILYDLIFINQNLGWRLGGHSRMDQGYIWITDNGGNEWTKQLFHSKAHLRSGFFIDTQTGWVVGNKLYILKTEDGGISWDERNFSNQFLDRFNCVHFANKTHGCAVGSSGKLYFTTNGGDNWKEEYSNVMVTLNSVFLLNDSTGWAVGNNGAIIKTSNFGISSINMEYSEVTSPQQYILYQNYPNPFNSVTTLAVKIPHTAYVSLEIFDISGKIISTLISRKLSSGTHKFHFQANTLPSGVYYYKIKSDLYSEVKKMILLK